MSQAQSVKAGAPGRSVRRSSKNLAEAVGKLVGMVRFELTAP